MWGRLQEKRPRMATVTIRLDDDTRDRLAAAAEARGLTLSTYIRDALEVHLELEPSEDLEERPGGGGVVLTTYERKVLQMLHRITLATHGDLDRSYYDAEGEVRMIKVLEGGFASEYDQEFADIDESMPRAECELVWDILDMFRVIKASVDALGEDGWTMLGMEGAESKGTFRGFDLNDSQESRLLAYARYLIASDRWAEQAEVFSRENDGGNSHRRMLPTYRAMLRVFKPLWREAVRGARWHLSPEDLKRVLLARP